MMWREEPNGDLSAVLYGMRLVIRESNGFARFLLLGHPRRADGEAEVLLESGSEDDVGAAKERAAQRAASVACLLIDGPSDGDMRY
jgi:hypothetical protein